MIMIMINFDNFYLLINEMYILKDLFCKIL